MRTLRVICLSFGTTLLLCSVAHAATLSVKQDGSGDYTTILDAMTNAHAGDIISVDDSNVYAENVYFTTGTVTLQAGSGQTPTIELSEPAPAGGNAYINAYGPFADQATIKGFTVTFNGTPTDNNAAIRGASNTTVEDCVIIGVTSPSHYRALHNVKTVTNVEVTNCGMGLLYDGGVDATFTNLNIHDCVNDNSLTNGTLVFNGCTLANCRRDIITQGNSTANITLNDSTIIGGPLTERCIIRVNSDANPSTLTMNNCWVTNAVATGGGDLMLLQGGVTIINDSVLSYPRTTNAVINCDAALSSTIVDIDHCDLITTPAVATQWMIFTVGGNAPTINVSNSILTGNQGIYNGSSGGGVITSSYNNVFCTTPYANITEHSTDINEDPLYAETANAAAADYLQLRPTSPSRYADSLGSYQGSKGVAVIPAISLPSSVVDFGTKLVGSGDVTQNLTVDNVGLVVLNISDASFVGSPSDFSIDPAPASIGAGGNAAIVVHYTPVTEGAVSATLRITTDDPFAPTTDVTIQATGTTASEVPDWMTY